MDKAIDFIRDFEPSVFGLDTWAIWVCFGLILLIFILANWLASFLQPTTNRRIRKTVNIVFYVIFGGVLIFVVLNSMLTERYDKLTVMLFLITLPYLKKWVENFYKRYDKYVDGVMKK